MADNTQGKKSSEKKASFFDGVKAEWRKIIWPSKSDLIKQTLLVIVISVLLCLAITVVDRVALALINLLLGI